MQLADGDLSQDDFKFLLKGKKALLEIHVNTQIGLAKVAVDKFNAALVDLIIDTAFDTFL